MRELDIRFDYLNDHSQKNLECDRCGFVVVTNGYTEYVYCPDCGRKILNMRYD